LVIAATVFINTTIKTGIVAIFAGWAKGKPAIVALAAAGTTMLVIVGLILLNGKGA
jgi:hypothetical protein